VLCADHVFINIMITVPFLPGPYSFEIWKRTCITHY